MSKSWHEIYKERGHSYGNAPDPTTHQRGESPDERRDRLSEATRRDERGQYVSPRDQALADLREEAARLREQKEQKAVATPVSFSAIAKALAKALAKKAAKEAAEKAAKKAMKEAAEKATKEAAEKAAKEAAEKVWKAPIRNKALAGKTHKSGVPFDKDGFPDFKDHLYKGGINDVKIKPTGSKNGDFAAANKASGYSKTPGGYTWHHHQETGRMQLVDSKIHGETGHTGGWTLW